MTLCITIYNSICTVKFAQLSAEIAWNISGARAGSGHPSPRHVPARSLAARAGRRPPLLHGACAATYASTDNALPAAYNGFCTTEIRGYKSRSSTILPEIKIPAEQNYFKLDIPDKCMAQDRELVGGVVTACDTDEPPIVTLAPMAAGPGAVRRRGTLHTVAHAYVKLYCI
ncbi:uncharacterized protein [Choristoneura fumiferana]|uniref:uncharacterized protein n=1 Tax=Choristoneura fumiferana TaxID=7141 RepID=UPI003D1552E2